MGVRVWCDVLGWWVGLGFSVCSLLQIIVSLHFLINCQLNFNRFNDLKQEHLH